MQLNPKALAGSSLRKLRFNQQTNQKSIFGSFSIDQSLQTMKEKQIVALWVDPEIFDKQTFMSFYNLKTCSSSLRLETS